MNSRSSNESEVIGNSEYLPTNIWYENFMKSQGYQHKDNYFLQDNKGAEKTAKMAGYHAAVSQDILTSNFFG